MKFASPVSNWVSNSSTQQRYEESQLKAHHAHHQSQASCSEYPQTAPLSINPEKLTYNSPQKPNPLPRRRADASHHLPRKPRQSERKSMATSMEVPKVEAVMIKWSRNSCGWRSPASIRDSRYAGRILLPKVLLPRFSQGYVMGALRLIILFVSHGTQYRPPIQTCLRRSPRAATVRLWHGDDRIANEREGYYQPETRCATLGYSVIE